MDYTGFVTALSTETEISSSDANFIAILPTVINDAEMRCYRDLDLLTAYVTDTGATCTANQRTLTLPTTYGRFISVDQVSVFTPVSTTTTRNIVVPSSVQLIDSLWRTETAASATTVPTLFARLDDTTLLLGPPPGNSFRTAIRGTIRPTPLSVSNTTSWLSQYSYDLFFASAMVSMSAYMRNFGAQADNPQMAQSWQGQYDARLAGALKEELRKKFVMQGTERR